MARKLIVFWLLLLLGNALVAQEAAHEEKEEAVRSIIEKKHITLDDLFRLAELSNPSISAAKNSVQAKSGRLRQMNLYPNPTLEAGIEDFSTSREGDRTEKVSIVQPLVLSGRLGAAADAAHAEREAALQTYYSIRRDVFRSIHLNWVDQLHFQDAMAEIEELLRVAKRTLEIAQTRFDARAAPESQVTKALLEVFELELDEQQLIQGQRIVSAELSSLLGGESILLVQLAGSLAQTSISGDEVHSIALSKGHPALQSAQWNIDAALASVNEAKAARYPDLELSFGYGRVRALDESFLEFGLSLPLPIFDRKQGRLAETRSEAAVARDLARLIASDLQVDLETARQRYLTASDQLNTLVDRIGPAAERGLTQAQNAYKVGRLSFLELIDAQHTHADVRLRTLELKKDRLVAEAELMSLVGIGPYEMREETSK